MASFLGSIWQNIAPSSDRVSTADHIDFSNNELLGRRLEGSNVKSDTDGAEVDSSTPKAQPHITETSVPTFELSEHVSESQELSQRSDESSHMSGIARSSQALREASTSQEPSILPQSDLSASPRVPRTGLLPQSSQTTSQSVSSSRTPQSLVSPSMNARSASSAPLKSGLMPPPRGPLPNRGPPGNSQQRVGSNSRGKVLLSPGHSPMDWASLTRSNNLSGVPAFQTCYSFSA